MEDKLQVAFEIASKAHEGQRRKPTKEPYIQHPLRVMQRCQMITTDICVLAAALLHDVLEKTAMNEIQLRDQLSLHFNRSDTLRILALVKELTDVYTPKDYPEKNNQQRKRLEAERLQFISSDGQTIKYADIMDNCDKVLLASRHDAEKSISNYTNLLQLMPNGNTQLYGLAITTLLDVQLKLKPADQTNTE